MKQCCRCNTAHPISEFYRDKNASDGLSSWCKVCQKVYTKQLVKAKKKVCAKYSTKRFEV